MKSLRRESSASGVTRRGVGILLLILAMLAGALTSAQLPGTTAGTSSDTLGVETPDYPEGQTFDPNKMKDIKAGDPGAGINLIEAPTANNQGQARLSYPLEVPPGRANLAPSLALQYNSGAANGWTGMGWDLPVPAITIDTRWGVPRYDGAKETETYLLNGEQLTPVAHRSAAVARSTEKVFHTRVEGRFSKIVRHGDGPANYWWEVTEKDGTRHFYGGVVALVTDSVLADGHGNIATWALLETRDADGNFVRYHHVRVADGGVANASVPGVNLYPKKITYTGHGTTEGRYSVTFVRDRERGEPRRQDVGIDARNGFKKVTADLLRRVEVRLDSNLIRAYEMNYGTGAFHKTLLRSVSQFGADNSLFNTHEFEYYDDIRDNAGAYQAFGEQTGWSVPDDGLGAGVRDGEASALASNTSKGAGGHLYVGYNPTGVSKSNSAGVKVGYNAGSSDGLLALADVNGDNLPDKVFRSGGGIFYRPNLSGPNGQARFGDTPIRLTNLPGISSERTSSGTVGVESYFGVAAQLDYVSTTTSSDRYFSDVNGDGITDLVNNGGVLFGHLDENGNPAYSNNSADTPVPVGSGGVSGTIVGDQTAEFERQVDAFPLLDSVRRWIAPYDGTVRVDGRVKLVEDTSPERAAYTRADGVRVTIQHGDTELWAQRIGPRDHIEFAPSGVDSVQVQKGDALYFRVQSVLDGQYDQVAWDPDITYTNLPASTDVNGLADARYLASRDFTLAGRPSVVTVPLTGTLHLSGDVVKSGPTSDDVTVVISRNGTDVYSETLSGGSGGTAAVNLDIPVTANDRLSWRLKVDSPVDAGALRWVPRAHYTAAEGVDTVVDEQGNPTLTITPPYEMDVYPASTLTAPQGFHTATQTGQLTVQPALAFANAGDARVVFTVKKRGALLAKQAITITDGVVPAIAPLTVDVTEGDELFFDFSTTDPALLAKLTAQSVTVNGATVPSALHAAVAQGAFAQPYRGWAAIGYEGNRNRASSPINQSDLVLDEDFRDSLPDGPTEADVPGFTDDPTVDLPKIVVFAPLPAQGRWAGADDNTWVAAGGASSSRYGMDTIDVVNDADFAGATGVSRRGRTQQISTTFGVSIPGIGAGASVAKGESTGQVDFLDLNGDRFPDVVGSGGIQYSDLYGGLGSTRGSVGGSVRESDSLAYSVSANAGSPARTSSTARGQDIPSGGTNANSAKAGTEMPALGVGGSLGGGESDAAHDLLDINGDGLPDKVYENGDAALNLGYSFAAREPWPGGPLNAGKTSNAGVNLGFNTSYYGFAGGVSASTGTAKTDATLMDMNGDGLQDRVFASGGNPVAVAINTGSGFAQPVPFGGSMAGVNADANASLGGGAYFTFGFCFVFGCIVFNPGADVTTGIGRTEVALRDVNGDGYVDQVKSTEDSELVVAANRTGRTNLLKTVSRPLGGRIGLDYTRDGNTYDSPESRWVLSRTVVFDGHAGDGQDRQVSTFKYENGKYDRLEREFLGFGTVTAQQRDAGNGDAVYRTVTDNYRTDGYYTRGLLTRSRTTDSANRPFLETENTYQLRDVATGGAASATSTTATVFPLLARTDRRFYEGQAAPGKSTFIENTYDEFGNVTRTFDAADTGTADDVETNVRYSGTIAACRDVHVVGLPVASDIRGSATGTVLRRSEADVDCGTANVRQVREYLADGTAAVTDMTYFDNGNLKSVTEPANKTGQRFRLDYTYDTVVDIHVESITDSFGYRSSSTHDLNYGLPAIETDQNGQQARTDYDVFGRVDSVTGPYELASGRPTIDFEYHHDATVPYAITRHIDRTAGGVRDDTMDTVLFVDGLKRTLQTKKDAAVTTAPGQDPQQVMTVSGRTVYDFVGRGVEHYYPVTEPKGPANTTFNTAFDTVTPTKQTFDILDRVTRTTIPDNTFSTMAYGFGPDRAGVTRFETVSTDANTKQRRTYTDVRELTTSVKEFNPAAGQPVIWTSYGYDPLRRVTSVVDDKGNTTGSAYDMLNRRTIVDSPDGGRTETKYDPAGNTTAKITAKLRAGNKAIEYDYQYNRLSGIRYPTFPGNNITYTYGAPGAPDGTANRISSVRDAAGTVTRAYGPLGETTRETRTVTAINGPARTYTTSYDYDAFNRMLSMTYPDGEVLTYSYDSGGQVTRATGRKGTFDYTYLARLDYDKFGQRALMETGTGVRTTYTYDPADRQLATLKAALPDGHKFQNISYHYDKVGNITQVVNDVPLPHGKPIGGPSVQTYSYDDLYQVTSAWGEYRNKDNKLDRQRLTLTHDSIHNTTSKDQLHEVVVNPGSTTSTVTEASTVLTDEPVTDPVTDPALEPVGPVEEPVEDPALIEPTPTDGKAQVQKKTTYAYGYTYASGKPHAPSKVGPVQQAYDQNGNLVDTVNTEPPAPGKRRQLVWDEENRLACNQDHNRNTTIPQDPSACGTPQQPATVRYVYDDQGNRIVKDAGPQHIYPNQNFSERNGTGFKHIWIGETRLATKTVKPDESYENHQFYFHADHLGSSSYVTDESANLTEHLEYFAFGETWVNEHPAQPTPVPYQFGGKEIDEETGLYYHGARYYNPKTDQWQSPDPALGSYLDGSPNGGVYQPFNLASYTFANNNPVRLTDPTGASTWNRIMGGVKAVGGVLEMAAGAAGGAATSWTGVGAVAGAVVVVHGADVASSGLQQLWTGEQTSSLTSRGLQAAGMSRENAELVDAGVSIVGSMGTSAIANAPRAAGGMVNATGAVLPYSSARLGANLVRAGFAQPAQSAAHHIVAGGAARSAPARAVLQRFGIGIDEAANGVFLPANLKSVNPTGAAVHSTIHTDRYYAAVNQLLGRATSRQQVIQSLAYIRQRLLSGGFP